MEEVDQGILASRFRWQEYTYLNFAKWTALLGLVPRIAVNNDYSFAGNAALFGIADIRIAIENSSIGMAGLTMIKVGGLGWWKPSEVGRVSVLARMG